MAESKNPNQIQEELAKKNNATSVKKLTFDPLTGELIMKDPTDPDYRQNEVVVDQIYKDGFFKK